MECFDFLIVDVSFETAEHAIESHLCRIGYEGEHGMFRVIINTLEYRGSELLTQFFAFLIDISVRASTEIDAFKRALGITPLVEDAFDLAFTILMHNERTSRIQFLYVITFQVEGGLQHRAFAGQGNDFIILIPESGTYAPRVAHGEHLTTACKAAHHISTVKIGHGGLQHVGHVHMVFNIGRDVTVLETQTLGIDKVALHFTVKPVPHQFKGDVAVAVDSWILPLVDNTVEYLVDVCHVEVSTQTQVLGPPVVAPQERMHIRQATLACGGIAQMPHIQFSRKRQVALGIINIGQLLCCGGPEFLLHCTEDFGDGIRAFSTLPEHILRAWHRIQIDTGHACTLLSAVVLFFHHQVELVQPIHPCTIFLLVVGQWFQQSDHCHPTFMF